MRRCAYGLALVCIALAMGACTKPKDVAPNRNDGAVVVLMNKQGGGCKVLAYNNVGHKGARFDWQVYNFCDSANGQTIAIRFDNSSPAKPGTEHFQDAINSRPPDKTGLWMVVDQNPQNGRPCNVNGLCYAFSFYLGTTQLADPDFEVDP